MGHLVYIEANSTLSMKEGLPSKDENIITNRNFNQEWVMMEGVQYLITNNKHLFK